MVAPTRYVARLREPMVSGDPSSAPQTEQLPTYNAYSIDGDVTAPLVFVNYGVPADYERLERLGISVKGAIVIAKYGGSWRGIKPKVAAEHGAHRLPDLFRSAGRRLRPGRRLPQGPLPSGRRRTAGQRDGHAAASRRIH
jgi:N-acetylated-alpha-linked acidic dipeptidase